MLSCNNDQSSDYYVKKKTWYQTMLASCLKAVRGNGFPVIASEWYSAGPFTTSPDSLFDRSFGPESNLDLSETFNNDSIRWKRHTEWVDGEVQELGFEQNSVYYLQRILTAGSDTSVTLYLGSDDGIKVWCNETLLLSNPVIRGCSPNQDSVILHLKKGINHLLLRINNFSGGFAFYASFIRNNILDLIWKRVQADFNSPQDMQEMAWEQAAGIWTNFILNGQLSELAQRYLDAYYLSCEERCTEPSLINPDVKNDRELFALRDSFIQSRRREYVILTPPAPRYPLINGPSVFGVRPGNPFLYTIPVTGDRPILFTTEGLPQGLSLNKNTGIITGTLNEKGDYPVLFKVQNALGSDSLLFTIVVGDKIALTPPMGWNSWNCFGCAITEEKIKAAADAMVNSGLINYGWSYVNIDDCWMKIPEKSDPILIDSGRYSNFRHIRERMRKVETLKSFQHGLIGPTRDTNGMILSNKDFPDMKALTSYIHDKGLKAGIYISPGPLTCQCYIGSYLHEDEDAEQFARWQFDYLKYDWCGYSAVVKDIEDPDELKKPYIRMRQSLDKVKRDIVYSLCQYGWGEVWKWGAAVGGNCWRTTGDISDSWSSMAGIAFRQVGLEKYASPGGWNDPDMLVVGWVGWGPSLRPTRLTANEQYTHITLWSLFSAPLLIGCDMTRLDHFTLSLLTNREVLAVNQDRLGKQASRFLVEGTVSVWVKPLYDGCFAVGIINSGEKRTDFTLRCSDIGITTNCRIRDIWRQKDIAASASRYACILPRHGSVMLKLFPLKKTDGPQ